MEQDEALYEYKMGDEVFRFEAHSHEEAEKMRGFAIEYFAEKMPKTLFSEDALVGPDLAQMPKSFVFESPSSGR